MPVGQYTGGVEHAILHLLYSRFFTKVLHDMGMVGFTEPFPRLMNQGQVIYGGAAMSKSRGNLVEPMPLVERYGADTVRLTMLFAGPFEDDVDWKTVSTEGMHKWLRRVHRAVFEAAGTPAGAEPQELRRLAHRTVKGVTDDLERYGFNVAISKLMVLTNEIHRTLASKEAARDPAELLVLMLAPLAPFLAEELWREALGHDASVHTAVWPSFDPDLAREERVVLVVQVDGKVRDKLEVSPGLSEAEAEHLALGSERVRRALDERRVARVVARPPRLVNVVTAPA
jgi:leucyl-tRNA synthetase